MTIKEAVKKYKLDRRHRWYVWSGNVVRVDRFTRPCFECNGKGCDECGYTGKRRDAAPDFALDENNIPIEVTDKDFTKG